MTRGVNFLVDEKWEGEFALFYDRLLALVERERGSSSASGASAADDAARALGVYEPDLNNFRLNAFRIRRVTSSTTTGDHLLTALSGDAPSTRLGFETTPKVNEFWTNTAERRLWLSEDSKHGLRQQIKRAFVDPDFGDRRAMQPAPKSGSRRFGAPASDAAPALHSGDGFTAGSELAAAFVRAGLRSGADLAGVSAPKSDGDVELTGSDQPWVELTIADFTPPEDPAECSSELRSYLQGSREAPYWAAGTLAAPRSFLDRLLSDAENNHAVLLHGPTGEGKTTILWQLASRWLESGRRVFVLWAEHALRDPAFVAQLRWSERPLLLMDDLSLKKPLPSWFEPRPGNSGGCLVAALQSRLKRAQFDCMQLARPAEVPLRRVQPSEADTYVDLILQAGAAAPDADRELVKFLFLDGLRGGAGGLWPAMWQATRGYKLDDRIRDLVSALASNQSLLRVVAALTFVAWHCEPATAGGVALPLLPRRSLIGEVIKQYGLKTEMVEQDLETLAKIGEHIDGELRGADLDELADPSLDYRHPKVTEAMFRWVFGGTSGQRGSVRRERWNYYLPLARSLPDRRERGDNMLRIMQLHRRAWLDSEGVLQATRAGQRFITAKELHDLGLASRPGFRTADQLALTLAEAALDDPVDPAAERELAIGRIEVATADPSCPVAVLEKACKMMQKHHLVLPATRDLPQRDWSYFADLARQRARGDRRTRVSLAAWLNAARQRPLDPGRLIELMREADVANQPISASMLGAIASIVQYFGRDGPGSGTVFAEGEPDESLESLRSLLRFFWKSMSARSDLVDLMASQAGTPRARRLSHPCRSILDTWAASDKEAEGRWPAGVMTEVEQIHAQQGQWNSFFAAYSTFFPD